MTTPLESIVTKGNITQALIRSLAFVLLIQNMGCTSISVRTSGDSATLRESRDDSNGRKASVENVVVDDRVTNAGEPIYLVPGIHNVKINTKWSNGAVDTTELSLTADAYANYLIHAFELAPGQDPAMAVIYFRPFPPTQPPQNLARTFRPDELFTFIIIAIGTAPLWVPIVLWKERAGDRTLSKPFRDCCFVWIADAVTHKLLSGVMPSGIALQIGEIPGAHKLKAD